MALTDNGMGAADIAAIMGANNGGFGFGNDGAWWLLILLFAMNGGWGFGGWGNGAMMGAAEGGFGLYPWMNQNNQINDGFRDQMLNTQISSIGDKITSGFGDVQLGIAGVNQNICQSGNNIVNALNSGFANAETAANARQMADMQQNYNAQIATLQAFNGVNSGVADLRYTVATEACADRSAIGDALQNVTMQNIGNTNQIVSAINGGIQSIKDQLCDYRNAQKDETIANLRQELLYSRGQASQVEQTAQLLANNNAQTALFQQGLNNEVDALYNRLNNCPVSTVPVYGKQPIFQCGGNGGCGYGVA